MESKEMRRYSVTCGQLRCTIMAPTAFMACKDAMDFAKGGETLGHFFHAQELVVENATVCRKGKGLRFKFDDICAAAGWDVE